MPLSRVPKTLALAAVVALALASSATPGRYTHGSELQAARQQLIIVPFDSRLGRSNADTGIDLVFPLSQSAPAKVVVYVPGGYGLDLASPAGTTIGTAITGSTPLRGNVVTDSPARYTTDAAAVACAGAAQHAAVWVLQLASGSISLPIAVFVDPTSGTETGLGLYKLQACFGAPEGGPTRINELFIELTRGLTNPATPGEFVWRAFVTPFAAGTTTADPAGTVEVRSIAPLPEGVIVRANVNVKKRTVTVSGTLVLAGAAAPPGLIVTIYSSAKANLTNLKRVANVKTKAKGAFSLTRKITKTTYFWAVVEGYRDTCLTGPSTAPLGCVRETLAPAFGNRATAKVPIKKKKK
jgi:hypothetical protein